MKGKASTLIVRNRKNFTIPVPTYADLEQVVAAEANRHRARLLRTAMRHLYRVGRRRPRDRADELSDEAFDATLAAWRVSAPAASVSRAYRDNIVCAFRKLAVIRANWIARRVNPETRCLPLLFDLQNRNSTWGVRNRRDRALAPYVVKRLPSNVENILQKYLQWRDGKHSRHLIVTDLSGRKRKLRAALSWGRRPNVDKSTVTVSEQYTRSYINAFFGFLQLPSNAPELRCRGLGIPPEKLRFGHFLCGCYVAQFLEFLTIRNDGVLTTHAGNFVQVWRQIIAGSESYARWAQTECHSDLRQILGRRVPRSAAAWHRWIDEQADIVEEAAARLSGGRTGRMRYRVGRDPFVHLALLLERPRPLAEVVWPTIHFLMSRRPRYPKKRRHTEAELAVRIEIETRIFTLTAFTAAPFRLGNWADMQWGVNLFRCPRGKWRIFIPPEQFKNGRFLRHGYNGEVQESAQGIFTVWYETWKACYGFDPLDCDEKPESRYVMAIGENNAFSAPHRDTIRQRLNFTKQIWNLYVGPTAFRHIVATDWLKLHPDDWITVAGLLHDSVAVVMKAYAHLRAQDHIRRVNDYNRNLDAEAKANLKKVLKKRRTADISRDRDEDKVTMRRHHTVPPKEGGHGRNRRSQSAPARRGARQVPPSGIQRPKR